MESGKPLTRNFLAQPMGSFGNGNMLLGAESHTAPKVGRLSLQFVDQSTCSRSTVIQHFHCRSLSIGSWRRVGQNAMDLVIFYSLGDKPCLTYYINNESAGYKIEFPFSYIKNVTLESGQSDEPNVRPAGLVVELNRPPNFFMDSSGSGGFYQCGDFTENQQASQILQHHLGGDPRVLSGQLARLTLLESFQNRHNPFIDTGAVASAPVSPIMHRPASQPNAMSHPQTNLFHESTFGMSLQPPRGHKRTRSRSVPAITDFSFLQQPMPSFHVQHPSTTITDQSIFAPIPQHTNNLIPGHTNNLTPSHNLRINTDHHFGMDFRQYPMSATTNSPSEYNSPGFFGNGNSLESMSSAEFTPSYSLPFLSPMPENQTPIQPSMSPLSELGPVIAGHSPPLHRSASVDFLNMNHDPASDDGIILSEMYSKQNLNLSIRSPTIDSHLDMHLHDEPTEDLDLHNIMTFGTINPSALDPDNRAI